MVLGGCSTFKIFEGKNNTISYKDNTIEINQQFKNNNLFSEHYQLSIDSVSFVTLSAYSFDVNNEYDLQYRVKNNNTWTDWKNINEASNGKEKRVYGPATIFTAIDYIQFQSSSNIADDVIVRLFIAKKKKL